MRTWERAHRPNLKRGPKDFPRGVSRKKRRPNMPRNFEKEILPHLYGEKGAKSSGGHNLARVAPRGTLNPAGMSNPAGQPNFDFSKAENFEGPKMGHQPSQRGP